MKIYLKNFRETMYPLFILNWLTGLGLTNYPIGNRRHQLFLLPIITIAIFFWMTSLLIDFQFISCFNSSSKGHNTRSKVLLYFETLTATFAIFNGWFNREKMDQLTDKMEGLNDNFKLLGFKRNYYKTFKQISCRIFVYLFLIISLYIVNVLMYSTDNFYKRKILCPFIIHWSLCATTVVDLSFIFTLQFFEAKLKNLKSLLQSNYSKNSEILSSQNNGVNHRVSISNLSINIELEIFIQRTRNFVKLMQRIHLILYDQLLEINEIYGKYLLLQVIVNFVGLICWFFNIAMNLHESKKLQFDIENGYFLLKCVLILLKLFHINISCAVISKEIENIKRVLEDMKELRKYCFLKKEIDWFYTQLNCLHFDFSTYGFDNFGIDFTLKFIGSVFLYVCLSVVLQVVNPTVK